MLTFEFYFENKSFKSVWIVSQVLVFSFRAASSLWISTNWHWSLLGVCGAFSNRLFIIVLSQKCPPAKYSVVGAVVTGQNPCIFKGDPIEVVMHVLLLLELSLMHVEFLALFMFFYIKPRKKCSGSVAQRFMGAGKVHSYFSCLPWTAWHLLIYLFLLVMIPIDDRIQAWLKVCVLHAHLELPALAGQMLFRLQIFGLSLYCLERLKVDAVQRTHKLR